MAKRKEPIWIARAFLRCSACRRCEIACSLSHENRIRPEASRIRVFMLVPGVEFPHFCAQCEDYPCVKSCQFKAFSISKRTGAVVVKAEKCTACGKCMDACPGRIPHMHPREKHILICDLCEGDPKCVKTCQEGGWNVLKEVRRGNRPHHLYARMPDEVTRDLASRFCGEQAEEFV